MKRVLTFFIALILCCTLFAPVAFAEDLGTADSTVVSAGGTAEPQVEQKAWVWREHNGYYEKRLWSLTYGKWLTDWIVVCPIP